MADPVTVWLLSRESVAKCPCKCGSLPGIYNSRIKADAPPKGKIAKISSAERRAVQVLDGVCFGFSRQFRYR